MTEIGIFGIAWQVASMNLILYGSLATVAYSKSWCALVCNFLDMMLGWASEIRRFTRTRENLGEKWRVESPFFFSGVAVSNHYWFTACPFQQIGICNDLQSLIFSGVENTRDDGPGKMNPCCFLICRFSQARIIQPAPGTPKRGF